MTFNEADVNRDKSGKFDTKTGSAPGLELGDARPAEREAELRRNLAQGEPGTNGATVGYWRGRQELEDAVLDLPTPYHKEFLEHVQNQPAGWLASRAERAAAARRLHNWSDGRLLDHFSARAEEVNQAQLAGHVRYANGKLTLDADAQDAVMDGLSEMLQRPISRDGAFIRDFDVPERKVGVTSIVRVSKVSVTGEVSYHIDMDNGRSVDMDEGEAKHLLDQVQYDSSPRD